MTVPVPHGRVLLSQASRALDDAVERSGLEPSADLRLRLLEGASSRVGGYSLDGFDRVVDGRGMHGWLAADATVDLTDQLAQAVLDGALCPSLALASLGDSDLEPVARRRQGRYFTDSRLALDLTSGVRGRAVKAESILDPACGAGVLLVAAALQAASGPAHRAYLVRRVLWGVDRDPKAVRAARAAISSLTCDLNAVAGVCTRLMVADSLAAGQRWWRTHSPGGFDLVVGNPPWEKLKVTRHEHALSSGHQRHYGDDLGESGIDEEALWLDRRVALSYRDLAVAELAYQGTGEADLYKMFLELGARLTSESGTLAFLVPAGFIRNYGASHLREWLFRNFDIDILILDNHERYFEIDSRFKFLQLLATRRANRSIRFGNACYGNVAGQWKAETNFNELRRIQPDLSIPEVRGKSDWELLSRLRQAHWSFGSDEAEWHPQFHREVDMTNDRAKFTDAESGPNDISVIEGRMVHQHRASAKRYVGGRGRRAVWETQPPFGAPLQPQWRMRPVDLPPGLEERISQLRAGFCDITGQTNERTVLAALIPGGVVCGNKVPTIDFASDRQACAWVGIANSFVFDWLARRCVTTTLNFFILRSLPIPAWDPEDEGFLAIAYWSQALASLERDGGEGDLWRAASIRAKVEVLSAQLYGISVADLDTMMGDFPQVDRAQPPLPDEVASSVTRDLVVASASEWAPQPQLERARERVALARSLGAVPFVPNQHARAYRRQS